MTDRTALGDRMKAYEAVYKTSLPPRSYSVIRVDGRAFHTLLRGATKPFDFDFMTAMDVTAVALCEEIQGAVFGYVQSDEISVLVADFTGPNSQPWFGGQVQKQVSIAAATATAAFNEATLDTAPAASTPATFDARVFTLPNAVEVANYFLWRQRDAVRNSIAMAAQAKFSHKQLHGAGTGRMQEMLFAEHGINWSDYPDGAKRGRVVVRASGEREVTFAHKRTGVTETVKALRSWWEARPAPHFTAQPGGWLAEMIPPLPDLKFPEEDGAEVIAKLDAAIANGTAGQTVAPPDRLAAAFEAHADESLALANEAFDAVTKTWPRYCHCPGSCEGGPECLDDEGGPLPRADGEE